MEDNKPRSDSPTVDKELTKVVSIAANEGWDHLDCSDVTAAFLQGKDITRDVFVKPPKEVIRDGEIWKMRVSAYGLYDASRQWFLEVEQELLSKGMSQLTGDKAVFFYHKNDRLEGLVELHVDDFLSAGSEQFVENVMVPLRKKFKFGKIEHGSFRFCGLDIKKTKDGIESTFDFNEKPENFKIKKESIETLIINVLGTGTIKKTTLTKEV